MKKTINIRKRTMLRLFEYEIDQLKTYVAEKSNAPYATIKENAGISYRTVNRITETGSAERDTAIKMRDFLKLLRDFDERSKLATKHK